MLEAITVSPLSVTPVRWDSNHFYCILDSITLMPELSKMCKRAERYTHRVSYTDMICVSRVTLTEQSS